MRFNENITKNRSFCTVSSLIIQAAVIIWSALFLDSDRSTSCIIVAKGLVYNVPGLQTVQSSQWFAKPLVPLCTFASCLRKKVHSSEVLVCNSLHPAYRKAQGLDNKTEKTTKFSPFFQFALPSLLLHPFTTDKTGQQVQSDWKILHKWSWTVWEFSSCSITAHPKHFNKLLWFQQMPAFGFMCSSDSSLTKDWPFIQFQ